MRQEQVQINTKESNPIFSEDDFATTPNLLAYISFSSKDLLYWWYIQMPIFYLQKLNRISTVVSDQLSLAILIRYFFVPWKRHRAVVGYFIGIITKLLYLPIAIFIYISVMLIFCALMLLWILMAVFFTLISLFAK
jgi:hypothetical protein